MFVNMIAIIQLNLSSKEYLQLSIYPLYLLFINWVKMRMIIEINVYPNS
jgi:hypothetical protein